MRALGVLGAGIVALGEVWELWELDSSCLARFGSSKKELDLLWALDLSLWELDLSCWAILIVGKLWDLSGIIG